ncbi:MAG: methyltransferase domain-containing protein [Acidobacteria bacterium]|nr:methyltransferase domain-containing protein [Acidobacteriota bacterium]MCG3192550.1 Ubiquinone/menaquinone biosynthesis C-methyltransferase UbiE [Thermoanaerobaculia bacterium]MCK6681718.1 methyltransferase domain-containing protein [Thermoanaerobaculia bacterium]
MVSSRGLARSYTFIAPFYDLALTRLMERSRRRSIDSMGLRQGQTILLSGIGTGLDLPLLPEGVRVTGLDLTAAMLKRARGVAAMRRGALIQGDAESLPFASGSFDAVVLHLILAIVPDARRAFLEAVRVARPGAPIAVFDKFLADGKEPSAFRRIANRFTRPLATGLTLRFEDAWKADDSVELISNHPDLLGGTFRRILLRKC